VASLGSAWPGSFGAPLWFVKSQPTRLTATLNRFEAAGGEFFPRPLHAPCDTSALNASVTMVPR